MKTLSKGPIDNELTSIEIEACYLSSCNYVTHIEV